MNEEKNKKPAQFLPPSLENKGEEIKRQRGAPSFFPPPMMDTSHIHRKWLDVPYASQSPKQKMDIYLPEKGDGPFPVIIVIHGGAWLFGDKRDLQQEPMLEGLTRGYAVVCAGYRLSGDAKFPAQIHDCKAAIRYLRANSAKYLLKPDKFAIWGPSAGGYLAALVGTSAEVKELDEPSPENAGISSRVQAVIDWCGPVENFLRMDQEFIESGRDASDHSAADSPESKLLGSPLTEIPELVRAASPMTYITADTPPFLIQHGELDPIVPVQQSINFAAEMVRVAGQDKIILDILQGVRHHGDPAFETEMNLRRVFDFLDTHLISDK
jgi:acetyl esterase/lipase